MADSSSSRAHNRVAHLFSHITTDIPLTSQRLKDKVCIITGAGSGIGQSTAILWYQHGAKLLLVDYNKEGLEKTKQLIYQSSKHSNIDSRVILLSSDISLESSHETIISTCLAKFSRLDVYFANAGIVGHLGSFSQLSVEQFDLTYKINILGCFLSMKYAAQIMIKQLENERKQNNDSNSGNDFKFIGGSIITTASVAGLAYGAGGLDYSASKSAVISMTKAMAHELRGSAVRVNAICPGLIETGMTKELFEMARYKKTDSKIGILNPLLRSGMQTEIAYTALFLASDESSYINGQTIAVDGGLTTSMPTANPNITVLAGAMKKK